MITLIDKDGNKSEVENAELETQIKASWIGREVSNVVIDSEFGTITATVRGLGKNINCGYVEDYN